ncbi:MAG: PH domain-containing protein [bacterium]|nr:PH domain-containing protein [bacterium]
MMEDEVHTETEKRMTLSERKGVGGIEELLEGEPVYHLDPGVRIYWSIGVIASALFVWVIIMLIAGFTMDNVLGVNKEMYPLFFFTIIVLMLLPYLVWIELNYHNYTYQFRKKRIVIRKGVLNKERTVIPYTQIQNININRNVLQRALGIATIKIETAGTNPWESEGIIDGVGDYHSFVQHAMELVERSKHLLKVGIGGEKKEKHEEDTDIFYLKQILVQLIELKKVMELKDKPVEEEEAPKPKLKDEIGKLMRGKKKKKK